MKTEKRYLVYKYFDGGVYQMYTFTEKELFEMIQKFRFEKQEKFAVYEIGDCILDWS